MVVADLDAARGGALAHELGARAAFARTDVTSSGDVQAAMDLAATRFGAIHILVCCAGICPSARVLARTGPMDIELFRRVICVNLVGTFDALRLAAAVMARNEPNEEGERGVVITTSSVAAFEAQIGQVAYGASKAGVAGMTLTAARDLASQGIRVCSIAPGVFETPMLAAVPEHAREPLGQHVVFPTRLGRPQEYALLVEQIVSNPMLNGETIRLDGALRLAPR